MPTFLLGVYGYIAAGVFGLVLGGGSVGWFVYTVENAKVEHITAQNAIQLAAANSAALHQVQAWAGQMHDTALAYSNSQSALNDQIDTIQNELHNVKTHLPIGCKPDSERMHIIESAYAASHAAASGQ